MWAGAHGFVTVPGAVHAWPQGCRGSPACPRHPPSAALGGSGGPGGRAGGGAASGRRAPGGFWQGRLEFHEEKQMVLERVGEVLRPPGTPGQGVN